MITPLFSPLEEVRQAVRGPASISSFIHLVNGMVFAGEGVMLGLAAFRDLALITALGVGVMLGSLAMPLGKTLNGVLLSLAAFNLVQGLAVTTHHVRFSTAWVQIISNNGQCECVKQDVTVISLRFLSQYK